MLPRTEGQTKSFIEVVIHAEKFFVCQGLVPFCVVATLGTTNSCAFDNLKEIGRIQEVSLITIPLGSFKPSSYRARIMGHSVGSNKICNSKSKRYGGAVPS